MAIDIEEIVEKAFEQAFSKALDLAIQRKAEDLFSKAFQNGAPLARNLEEKIEQGFNRFIEEDVQWEAPGTGFKK